ncbi:MAG TPA: aminotransferase class III-fold pyridoxal phosphate-dependent enzyme [Jatrophihabitans sp.]|uniref:aspartate aminotransferase family protein n=1 Tax=Jatrophihabitans sp. TaxID=1932789 RepID=UPI002EF317BC
MSEDMQPVSDRAQTLQRYRQHLGEGAARVAESLQLPVEAYGEGAYVWDDTGRKYLQCGGYGVFLLGHRPPEVVAALHRQLDRHPVGTRTLISAELADAAADLTAVAPDGLDRVYFACTGAEAVEAAIKIARANGRRRVIAMKGGFHGKTLGALSATDRLAFRQPFQPLLPGVERVGYGDVEALSALLAEGPPACVIIEPVQGEGGVRIPPPGYLSEVARSCADHGALLIVDEIQTGLGRLGSWWGWDGSVGQPDMFLVGKALGGGCVPVSAVLCTAEAFRPLERNPRLHSSTFSGYPLGMVAARATLQVMREQDVPARAAVLGAQVRELVDSAATAAPEATVKEIRSQGLLIGVEFTRGEHAGAFSRALLGAGVIPTSSLGADTVVRLTPPVVLEDPDLKWLGAALSEAFSALAG